MKLDKILPGLALLLAVCAGCKSQYDMMLESNDVDSKYAAAFDYFNQGKYTRSAAMFESLSMLTNGTERDDTVQFYWALSNYSSGLYSVAETNFQTFLDHYPRSPFADNAEFLRVDCLYKATLRYELDQTPTYTAMSAISEYILSHPEGANTDVCRHMLEDLEARLDKKAFENARLQEHTQGRRRKHLPRGHTLLCCHVVLQVRQPEREIQAEGEVPHLHRRLS